MHLVELHAQVGNARARLFLDLQVEQKAVAVVLDGAQLVQLGIQPMVDHAAFAQQRRRLRQQRAAQQVGAIGRRLQGGGNFSQKCRLARYMLDEMLCFGERQQQTRQLARAHLAQRNAGADALHVAAALEPLTQIAPGRPAQRGDGLLPPRGFMALAQRRQQPVLQQAAAHAGDAAVEQRKQRRRAFAAQRLHQLQVALRGQRQIDQRIAALHAQAVHMGQRAALGVLGIGQQRRRRRLGLGQILRVPGRQAGGLQLGQQLLRAQRGVKLPFRPPRQRAASPCQPLGLQRIAVGFKCRASTIADQPFTGRNTRKPVRQLVRLAFGQMQRALRDAEPGQPQAVPRTFVHRQQQRFGFIRQQRIIGQRARRQHPHHLALHRPLAGADLTHLLTNGHRFAVAQQLGNVALHRMHRHASHHDGHPGRLPALRQRDTQQAGGLFSIGIKQLIEIPHAVENQGAGEVAFDGEILLHHRRVGGPVGRGNLGRQRRG